MHERTYDLAKQTRSKHACIYINVTNEFAFQEKERKNKLVLLECIGQWSPSLVK
jgi:hypothetical protein